MKRIISVILTLILAASALASCGASSPASSSSDRQYDAPAALYTRLSGKEPKNITFACGKDAAGYADLSSLRDEGYILRKSGGESFILAKTDDGLDRGVRYFVNHFEASGEDYYAYGEGYRVKKLTIAGRDVSEYVIRLNDNADECHTLAATELQKYIEMTCGAKLDIVTQDAPHMIAFDRVMDTDPRFEALGYEGFTLEVDANGNLWIHGGEDRGCLYGVYKLLQDHVGWRFYVDDHRMNPTTHVVDYLFESDHVDIPAGLNDTQKPTFDYRFMTRCATGDPRLCENASFIADPKFNGGHITKAASTGLVEVTKLYRGSDDLVKQPCFSDDGFIECVEEYYTEILDAKIAAGLVPGEDIAYLDVAQNDTPFFCPCRNCNKLYAQDGFYTGGVLYFTNAIADWLAEEYSPDIYALMLAYCGTVEAPLQTKPHDNVSAALCYFGCNTDFHCPCYAHCADGSECAKFAPNGNGNFKPSNVYYGESLKKWCALGTRMTVWYYPGTWDKDCFAIDNAMRLYEDFQFFKDVGVYGIYNCPSGNYINYTATGTRPEDMFTGYVMNRMLWNADITREEYDAMVYEFFEITCGKESAPFIADFYDARRSWAANDCWSTHSMSIPYDKIDFDVASDCLPRLMEDIDTAVALTESAEQEELIEMMSLTSYFTCLGAAFADRYVLGTAEQRAEYEKGYDEFVTRALKWGFMLNADHNASPDYFVREFPAVSENVGSLMGSGMWNYKNGQLRDCAKIIAEMNAD